MAEPDFSDREGFDPMDQEGGPAGPTVGPARRGDTLPPGRETLRAAYRGNEFQAVEALELEGDEEGLDLIGAVHRFWYLLLIPMMIGAGIGYWLYRQEPIVYRSSTELWVESTMPAFLDAQSGDLVTGLPGHDLLQARLKSDHVLQEAATHPALAETGISVETLPKMLASSLRFEQATQKTPGSGALVYFLYVDHTDRGFAEAAVAALSDALRGYFDDQTKNNIDSLKSLITQAQEKLIPDLQKLEEQYENFRKEATNLAWDDSGNLINRFREKQGLLQVQRVEFETRKDELDVKLATILNTAKENRDHPIEVMQVVSQLMEQPLGDTAPLASSERQPPTMATLASADLANIRSLRMSLQQQLLPMEVDREQYADSFGPQHASVLQLDQQIKSLKGKIEELQEQEAEARRLAQLAQTPKKNPAELEAERNEQAKVMVNRYVRGLRARIAVLDSQIQLIDQQIMKLGVSAAELTDAERQDATYKRKIDRAQRFLSQIEEQMARIDLTEQGAKIRVEPLKAQQPAYRVSPVLGKNTGIGTLFGALLGCGLIYLAEAFSKTYRSSHEVTRALDLPILGQVPLLGKRLPKEAKSPDYAYRNTNRDLEVVHCSRSPASEAFRRLRTGLFFESAKHQAKVIQVTSPVPQDGKSTISANLAASIAMGGKSVVLVDADLRRPQSTETFYLMDRPGITELLNQECDPVDATYSTDLPGLKIIPCGSIPDNPAEALATPNFENLIGVLREKFDFVIIDTPPLLVVADPTIVARLVDGVILTFRLRRNCRPQSKEAVAILRAASSHVLGCVINQIQGGRSARYTASSVGYGHYRRYERAGWKFWRRRRKTSYTVRTDQASPPRKPNLAAQAIEHEARREELETY